MIGYLQDLKTFLKLNKMKSRNQKTKLFLFLLCTFFSLKIQADNDLCLRMNNGIYKLSGDVPWVGIEAINSSKLASLEKYTGTTTVEKQINSLGRFGFAAVENHKIVGFIVAEKKQNFIQIISIAVTDGSMRMGIGSQLVGKVIDYGEGFGGIQDVRVIVSKEDEGATKFFEFNELKKTPDEVPNKFRNGMPGVILKYTYFRGTGFNPNPMMQPVTSQRSSPRVVGVITEVAPPSVVSRPDWYLQDY